MTPQIVILAVGGRPDVTSTCLSRLWENGGMSGLSDVGTPIVYYSSNTGKDLPPLGSMVADVRLGKLEKIRKVSEFRDIKRMILECDPTRDLIVFEDDVAPCKNAVRRIVEEKVPDDCGCLLFFDFRNQYDKPGIYRAPKQDLWGTQTVKVSAKVLPGLIEDIQKTTNRLPGEPVPKGIFYSGWDVWLGWRIINRGFSVGHYSPSLVQHLGLIGHSIVNPNGERPTAANFPGENWDAMGEWPEGVPIVEGPCKFLEPPSKVCSMHGLQHPHGFLCPTLIR